jgi:spore germination protein YaaH
MKKIIRLTESDLTRIVKRVMNEQVTGSVSKMGLELANAPKHIKDGFTTGCYTVQKGDQLLKIAKIFGLTLDDINTINGLKNDSIIPGQVIKVQNTMKKC